jgi:hypothetical protein
MPGKRGGESLEGAKEGVGKRVASVLLMTVDKAQGRVIEGLNSLKHLYRGEEEMGHADYEQPGVIPF